MKKLYQSLYILISIIACTSYSASVFAGMVLISDDRYISSSQFNRTSPGSATTGNYWRVNSSYADQASSFAEYRLYGDGAVAQTDSFNDNHKSVYSVTFSVDEILSYDLSGEFYAPYADVYAGLWENDSLLFSSTVPKYQSSSIFNHSGIFEIENEYTLTLSASRIGGGFVDDNWSFNMATEIVPVSAVPLPAAGWLMITGLGTLFGFMSKRRRS